MCRHNKNISERDCPWCNREEMIKLQQEAVERDRNVRFNPRGKVHRLDYAHKGPDIRAVCGKRQYHDINDYHPVEYTTDRVNCIPCRNHLGGL